MKKLFLFCLVAIFLGYGIYAFADTRVIVHTYATDDSVQNLSGTDSNTWKLVTTETDTSETYDFGDYVTASIMVRVDSINAADSAEFVVKPYVSTDTLKWAPVPETLLVQWGTVAAPSYYYKIFTTPRGAWLRFLVRGQGGNDSCNIYIGLIRQK